MLVFKGEQVEEYQKELDQLDVEAETLKQNQRLLEERDKEIKVRVNDIMDVLSNKAQDRVVIPVKSGRVWDRRLSGGDPMLDPQALHDLLGDEEFNRLCCTPVTSHVFVAEKFQAARGAGKITDEQVRQATKAPKGRTSLYRADGKTVQT